MGVIKNLTHFADDKEKMIDFKNLTKEEFLMSYSYLTEEEYDMTIEYCRNNNIKIMEDIMNYTYEKYDNHYIVVDGNGKTIAHCDNVKECWEEIEKLKKSIKQRRK